MRNEELITINIKLISNDGKVIRKVSGSTLVSLDYKGEHSADEVVIETEEKYVHISWDGVINEFIAYIPEGIFTFPIPKGEALRGFAPGTFEKESRICVKCTSDEDIKAYRNLCLNPLDYRLSEEIVDPDAPEWSNPTDSKAIEEGLVRIYPHVYANRVTRNEGCFYARNAIDGLKESGGHGDYPYHSWGGAVHEDLTLSVYFGREVEVDRLGLCLRSDYTLDSLGREHDTYWHTALIELEDGFSLEVNPKKLSETQYFELGKHTTSWLKLSRLDPLQHEGSQNFAALNQIEVWGKDL